MRPDDGSTHEDDRQRQPVLRGSRPRGCLIKKLSSAEAMCATLTDIGRLLAKEGTEFIRGLLSAYVDARSAAQQRVDVFGADGVARPHARTSTRTVETPFGEVAADA
ncbi:MAG: hypothetical protein HC869_05265 [Rhodospirillales bacterium]|nr:hypothetical protein [Rhodospirillales bacterium]